jgi:hypothetical protein
MTYKRIAVCLMAAMVLLNIGKEAAHANGGLVGSLLRLIGTTICLLTIILFVDDGPRGWRL